MFKFQLVMSRIEKKTIANRRDRGGGRGDNAGYDGDDGYGLSNKRQRKFDQRCAK